MAAGDQQELPVIRVMVSSVQQLNPLTVWTLSIQFDSFVIVLKPLNAINIEVFTGS